MNENTDYEPERRRWNILSFFSNDVLSVVVAPVRLILQRDGHQEALRENEVQRGEEEATVGSRGGDSLSSAQRHSDVTLGHTPAEMLNLQFSVEN